MASNEEYLDNLLKSVGNPEADAPAEKTEAEASVEETEPDKVESTDKETKVENDDDIDELVNSILMADSSDENKILTPEEIEAMFAAAEDHSKEETSSEASSSAFDTLGDMSEEEISKLIEDSNKVTEDSQIQENLNELLNNIDDQNVTEINDLLSKSDNYEAVNDEIGKETLEESETSDAQAEEGETQKPKKVKKERKKLFGKKKKEQENPEELENTEVSANPEETETKVEESVNDVLEETVSKKDKKPGLFAKILDYITEEDEEPEAEIGGENQSADTENESVQPQDTMVPSEENQAILDDLAKEDNKKKKGKKGKKEKEKESEDEDTDDSDKNKGKTGKKEKKPKKEKKIKQKPTEIGSPEPKLSGKKVRGVFILCFSVLVVILICCYYFPQLIGLSDARKAYYQGDYEQCYKVLYGKKLNDSDEMMFKRAQVMLQIERKSSAYNNYMAIGDELHAVDTLFMGVAQHAKMQELAAQFGLENEEQAAYQEILDVLQTNYGLSEEQVTKINSYKEDAVYTLRLKSIVERTEFVMPDFSEAQTVQDEEAVMDDVLDAEEELDEIDFAE